MTVHPPWRILRPGLLYFILSVNVRAGKIVSRGIRTLVHQHAKQASNQARYPLGHAGLVEYGSMDQCGGLRPSQPNPPYGCHNSMEAVGSMDQCSECPPANLN